MLGELEAVSVKLKYLIELGVNIYIFFKYEINAFIIRVKVFKNGPRKIFDVVCLGRPCHFNFFKGCFPQILFGPFLNALNHMIRYFNEFRSLYFDTFHYCFFFLSGFSFTYIHDSQDSRGRGRLSI